MARTFKLTDGGSNTVDLINTAATGIIGSRGGLAHGRLRSDLQIVTSPLSDGGVLRGATRPLITEKYRLNLKGSSHDNAASQIQTLHKLLLLAEQFHYAPWQTSPVYLEVQTTNETNARFAKVYGSPNIQFPDFFDLPFEVSYNIENFSVSIVREPYWGSSAPGTLPTALTLNGLHGGKEASGIEQFVANHHAGTNITHIYVYDASGPSWSANLVAATDFDLLPSTPAAGDILYVGASAGQLHTLVFDLSVLGSGLNGLWEYYWSGAWTTLPCLDGTNGLEGAAAETGEYALIGTQIEGHQQVVVNGVNGRWFRFRIISVQSSPVCPHQSSNQVVFCGRMNYIEIPATAIDGDLSALARFHLRLRHTPDSPQETHSRIGEFIAGAKSRGLTNYRANLNMTGGNPTGWAEVHDIDTSTVTDLNAPTGTASMCDFATTQTMAVRWRGTLDDATKCEDWRGVYQVFLRCYQRNGSAGDVTVQLEARIDDDNPFSKPHIFFDEIQLTGTPTSAGPAYSWVVNLGRLHIPPVSGGKSLVATPVIDRIDLVINAKSDNGTTPDLYMRDLILMPIDEMVWRATIPDKAAADDGVWFDPENMLIVDGGLIGEGAQVVTQAMAAPGTANHDWMMRSTLPTIEPDKKTEIYFLAINEYDTPLASGEAFESGGAFGYFVSLYVRERWHSLRGGD